MPTGGFPMWGEIASVEITSSGTMPSSLGVDLTRAVARVDVSVRTTGINPPGFTLASVHLYNRNTSGLVAPGSASPPPRRPLQGGRASLLQRPGGTREVLHGGHLCVRGRRRRECRGGKRVRRQYLCYQYVAYYQSVTRTSAVNIHFVLYPFANFSLSNVFLLVNDYGSSIWHSCKCKFFNTLSMTISEYCPVVNITLFTLSLLTPSI